MIFLCEGIIGLKNMCMTMPCRKLVSTKLNIKLVQFENDFEKE
jgi:hypothetical protein